MKEIAPGITVDQSVRFGKPVLKGTRVPVDLVVGKLAGGILPGSTRNLEPSKAVSTSSKPSLPLRAYREDKCEPVARSTDQRKATTVLIPGQ